MVVRRDLLVVFVKVEKKGFGLGLVVVLEFFPGEPFVVEEDVGVVRPLEVDAIGVEPLAGEHEEGVGALDGLEVGHLNIELEF